MIYLVAVAVTSVLSFSLAYLIQNKALLWGLIDNPQVEAERRQHKNPIPLGGGIAIAIAILISIFLFWWQGDLAAQFIDSKQLLGFAMGLILLVIGGTYDDKFGLPTWLKIMLPITAATAVVAGGIGVHFITNPFGGVLRLDQIKLLLFTWGDTTYYFTVFADLLTIVWLTLLMYTTKLLDGLDGLVTGITIIGAIILFFLSLTAVVLQFDTALLLAIVAAAFVGFVPYNWHPAKVFLGDAGSLIAGYSLGVIAIIAGGKIATTALVLGLPVIDALWVVGYRIIKLKKSPFNADRQHFHFRLLDAGFSVKQVVGLFYLAALCFGGAALFMSTIGKAITFIVLVILSLLAIVFVNYTTEHETN